MKNRLFNLLFLILIIFAFFLSSNLFSNAFIYVDDVNTGFCNSFQEIFKNIANGNLIANFFDKLFGFFLPKFFDIHPSVFKSQYFCYVESIFVVGFIFILNSFFYIQKKIDWFLISSFICSSSLLFYVVQQQPNVLFVYDGFFRMLLPALMFVGLFYLLIKSNENLTKKELILISLITFLVCISNEMLCVSTVVGFFIYSLFQIRNKKFFTLIWTICALCGCLVFIKTGAFTRKSGGNIPTLLSYFSDFIPFIKDYSKYIFAKHFVELFLIVIQMLVLFFKKAKEENVRKTCLLIVCFFVGILSFFLSLKLLGRTHYEEGQYWIIHKDLHMIYSFMLCSFNFALLRLIVNYELISKRTVAYAFITMALFFMISNKIYYENFFKYWFLIMRTEYYKAEKIIRFASLKNKTALLCKDIPYHGDLWPFYISGDDIIQEKNVECKSSLFIKFINQFEKEKIDVKFMFTDKETVDNFIEENGVFTKEELENIDFSRLKDKNFILNNKE